jgi:hypothetical protein
MIKIPKLDIENCEAFSVPHLDGIDMLCFFKAQEEGNFESLRMSTFAKKRVFSFEKFKAYIEKGNGKVFLDSNPKEEVYCISSCNLNELESIIYGGSYPIFLQNYDFNNDVYIRSTI